MHVDFLPSIFRNAGNLCDAITTQLRNIVKLATLLLPKTAHTVNPLQASVTFKPLPKQLDTMLVEPINAR